MNRNENPIKLVILGGENSGKTKFCEFFYDNNQDIDFTNYQSTEGAGFFAKDIIYKKNYYRLNAWDTPGQEKYDGLNGVFYRDADIIFIFFIYNKKDSFERANALYQTAKYNTKPNVIFALIGNKYDEDKICLKEEDNILHEEEILEFTEENNLIFGHLSIKEKYSNGFKEIFMKVMDKYIKNIKK